MNAGAWHLETGKPSERRPRRDRRLRVFLLMLALVIASWLIVDALPQRGVDAAKLAVSQSATANSSADFSALAPSANSVGDEARQLVEDPLPTPATGQDPASADARQLFGEARSLIKNKQYDDAIRLLDNARPQLQQYTEAYLVLGKALEGRREYAVARDFYVAATARDPYLADAYWGIATTSERLGELDSALGAMRTYLHTEPDGDPQRLRIAQARSAIWEWESKLGRGPWGPTKGIPPGFAEKDLKRDGRGVGVMMPLLDTLQADGTMKREVKHADKVKIFPRP